MFPSIFEALSRFQATPSIWSVLAYLLKLPFFSYELQVIETTLAISSKHRFPLRPCLGQLTLNLIAAGRHLSGSPNIWQVFVFFFWWIFVHTPPLKLKLQPRNHRFQRRNFFFLAFPFFSRFSVPWVFLVVFSPEFQCRCDRVFLLDFNEHGNCDILPER